MRRFLWVRGCKGAVLCYWEGKNDVKAGEGEES